jgi:hypothetical protein
MRGAMAATDDATITVWTKDGSMFRGEVVERVPNDHVTIKLATGETKRVEWKDVERDSTTAPKPTPTENRETPPPPGGVRVHLEGPEHARLERHMGSGSVSATTGYGGPYSSSSASVTISSTACYAPCDRVIPEGRYFAAAEGRRSSGVFDVTGGAHKIEADLGNPYALWGGGILAGAGLALMAVGTWYWGYGSEDPSYVTDKSPRTYGLLMIGVGVAATVGGIVMAVSNRNDVRVDGVSVARHRERSTFALTPTGFVF